MNIEIKNIDVQSFNILFSIRDRLRVCESRKNVFNTSEKINMNYFQDPFNYPPQKTFLGELPLDIPVMKDLSKVNMCSLDFISKIKGNHVVLDYACGLGSFVYYSNIFFKTYGYDKWAQIPKHFTEKHLNNLDISSEVLIKKEHIKNINPTIINVSGFWIEDVQLYGLDSVEYILSDPLYNSGRIKGEGVYFYKGDGWDNSPDKYGFTKIFSYPALDVYRKIGK